MKLDELGRPDLSTFLGAPKIPIVVVLDNIRSGMNVGSFFRTADAFCLDSIILCGITAQPPHKEILKTAIGASKSVKWKHSERADLAVEELKNEGFQIIGIEQTDQSIGLDSFEVNTSTKYALLFGNEVSGISDQCLPLLDHAIEIPQYGTKHSLNVSVCGGIVMHHFAKSFLDLK